MIKKLILVFIAVIALKGQAQEGTASPYSFYGIGTLKFRGTVENRSMGGLSVYGDSIHVNLRNPAYYAGKNLKVFNNESRPVKFAVGSSYSSLTLKNQSGGEAEASTTTFDYIAFSMPMGKFGFGFGLLPYSSVGYKLESLNTAGDPTRRYRGEGGLNRAYAGLGYSVTENLRVGVDISYNFGNVQNTVVAFAYNDGEPVQFNSREDNRSDLSGFSANIGVSYTKMINDKLEFVGTATYAPETTLSSENTRSISTIVINSFTGQEFVVNSIDQDLSASGLDETELTFPSRLSFGAGIGAPRKWFAGIEYTAQNTEKFDNPIFEIDDFEFENASTVSVGGFYIPNYNSFSGYFNRVTYRAGFRYETSGLKIKNESINEFGISFGVGLPVGGRFSNANVGFEFGKRGTTNQNLIQENFFNLNISLSLNDRWFRKRKFN